MCLGGDDDVPESTIQKMLDEALGRERKLLGLRQIVTRGQRILERAGVDTDAYGDAGLACRLDDGIDPILPGLMRKPAACSWHAPIAIW